MNASPVGKTKGRILLECSKSERRWSRLLEKIPVSDPTLCGHLKDLLSDGHLKKEKQKYRATATGVRIALNRLVLEICRDLSNWKILDRTEGGNLTIEIDLDRLPKPFRDPKFLSQLLEQKKG